MPASDDVARLIANVALSREHITKQRAILSRLHDQEHVEMIADAERLLVTMYGHLALEEGMLARYKVEEAERSRFE